MQLNSAINPSYVSLSRRSGVARQRSLFGVKITEFVLITTLVILGGCASSSNPVSRVGTESGSSVERQMKSDMVNDLVRVLPQILEPLSTTVQFNESLSGEIHQVIAQLAELSFGLQRVNADQGKYFLTLNDLSSELDTDSNTTRLRLSLGAIELTRSYRVVTKQANLVQFDEVNWRGARGVIAASPLQVAGTQLPIQLVGMELDDSLTDNNAPAVVASRIEYTTNAPIEGGIPTISLITSEFVQQVAEAPFPSGSIGNLYADSFKSGNMTHVSDGAFASVTDNYERVGRETIIFPNDSEFLGRPGKLQVKKVVQQFSKNTDLVGIVGCSNGPTKLAVGNEGLALGRAQRIAEEFYSAGLAREKVFNEGCWSTETGAEGFPNRGVVIDLWRRKV